MGGMTKIGSFVALFFLSPLPSLSAAWHEPLLQGFKISPDEIASISGELITNAKKAFMARRKPFLSTACLACPSKSYAEACPESWKETVDGTCVAPAAYAGICAKSQ